MEQQDKRHIPQASSGSPHNAHTRPAETNDKDKLRENPHNDERTITQNDEGAKDLNRDLGSGSTFARKDDEGMNRVTNEQEQNQVVNPQVENSRMVDSTSNKNGDDDDDDDDDDDKETDPELPSEPEIPADPGHPTENPYEHIGDDPDVAQKKIPKF